MNLKNMQQCKATETRREGELVVAILDFRILPRTGTHAAIRKWKKPTS